MIWVIQVKIKLRFLIWSGSVWCPRQEQSLWLNYIVNCPNSLFALISKDVCFGRRSKYDFIGFWRQPCTFSLPHEEQSKLKLCLEIPVSTQAPTHSAKGNCPALSSCCLDNQVTSIWSSAPPQVRANWIRDKHLTQVGKDQGHGLMWKGELDQSYSALRMYEFWKSRLR